MARRREILGALLAVAVACGPQPGAWAQETKPADPGKPAPKPPEAAPAQPPKPGAPAPAPQPSPPRIDRAQLREIYTGAIRYFNKQLAPAHAQKLADAVIDASLKNNVDARLLIAVLAVEGVLERTAAVKDQLLVQKRPAAEVVQATALDIKNRLLRVARFNPVTDDVIRKALAERGFDTHPKDKTGTQKWDYADKTFRLYQQLCGTETTASTEKPATRETPPANGQPKK